MTSSSRTALVTGASSGFGLLVSIELARAGFRVFATLRNLEKAQPLNDAAKAAGVTVETLALDVTKPESIRAAVAETQQRAGPVDVLINNAGLGFGGPFEDCTPEEIRWVMETNFFGAIEVIRAVLPGMRSKRSGHIINVSSISGRVGSPCFTAYAASKWALEGFSEALRHEVASFGINVVLVEPGMFRTQIYEKNRHTAVNARNEASPYFKLATTLEKSIDTQYAEHASDPLIVAKLMVRIAQMRAPKMRYLVGTDAKVAVAARAMLPEKWFHAVLLKGLG